MAYQAERRRLQGMYEFLLDTRLSDPKKIHACCRVIKQSNLSDREKMEELERYLNELGRNSPLPPDLFLVFRDTPIAAAATAIIAMEQPANDPHEE